MKKIDKLKELLFQIDNMSGPLTEYSMFRLEKIAREGIEILSKKHSEPETIEKLKSAVLMSDKFHKEDMNTDGKAFKQLIRSVRSPIVSFLYINYGIDF